MVDRFFEEDSATFPSVRKMETTDDVMGGDNGFVNIAPKQLVQRTAYLKTLVETLQGDTYTKPEVDQIINNLIDGAPDALNTLNELATALSDNDSDIAALLAAINERLTQTQSDARYVKKGGLVEVMVLTDNNRLSASFSGTTFSIQNNQEIYFPDVGIINTSSIPDFTELDASTFYHLRWSKDSGFVLIAITDNTYNPNNFTHRHPSFFENKIDDICLGGIVQGEWVSRVLTPNRNYHIKPADGTGSILFPFGYGDKHFKATFAIYASEGNFHFPVGASCYNFLSASNTSGDAIAAAFSRAYENQFTITTNNGVHESTMVTATGLVFENGNLVPDIQVKLEQYEDGGAFNFSNGRETMFKIGRVPFTVEQQKNGLQINYTNMVGATADVIFEVL